MAQPSMDPIIGQLVDAVRLRGIEDVHLVDEFAFLPCREGQRLTVCSINDPANPEIVSSFTHLSLGAVAGFAHDGKTIYITSQSNQRLLVIDAGDKSNLRLLGSVRVGEPDQGILYKVAWHAGYCYVASQSAKTLFVVDVKKPADPFVIGSVVVTTDDDGPFSVMIQNDVALVGTIFGKLNRLAVIGIKNPQEPQLLRQLTGPVVGHISGEVAGDLFYAVNWIENAFLVIDVKDPAHPRLQATLVDKRLGEPNRCVVAENRAYLPMVKGDGVAIIDISDPAMPTYLTSYKNPVLKKTYGVAVRGKLLFVGAREGNSLLVLDRDRLER